MIRNGKNLSVIVCNNGLGHIRRVVSILEQLYFFNPDIHTTILFDYKKINNLATWPKWHLVNNIPNIQVIHHDHIDPMRLKFDNYGDLNMDKKLMKIITHSDLVWSDNIVDVLNYRSDALLTGSFLWHEVSGNHNLIQKSRILLSKLKPDMVGNYLFATPDVKKYTNFYPVGFYQFYNYNQIPKKNNILLSCGMSGACENDIKKTTNMLIGGKLVPPKNVKIYIEKRLLPRYYPAYILPANFKKEMFLNVTAACIRPGLGTISDLMLFGIKPFVFYEENFEMEHNARILCENKVGEIAKNSSEALKKAFEYISNKDDIREFQKKHRQIKLDGAEKTAKIIANRLGM